MTDSRTPKSGKPANEVDAERSIRDRQLTTRPAGGVIEAVRLRLGQDGWRMFVRVSWRPGELLVLQRSAPIPKVYKTADNAIQHCWERYDYAGAIVVD